MLDPSIVLAITSLFSTIADIESKMNPRPIPEPYCKQLAEKQGWRHYNWSPKFCFTYSDGNERPPERIIITGEELRRAHEAVGEPYEED